MMFLMTNIVPKRRKTQQWNPLLHVHMFQANFKPGQSNTCNYNFKSNHDSVSSHHDPYRLLSASPNSSYRLVSESAVRLLQSPISAPISKFGIECIGIPLPLGISSRKKTPGFWPWKSFPKVADPVTGTTGAKMPSVLKQPPAEKLPTPVTDPVKAGVRSWRSEDWKRPFLDKEDVDTRGVLQLTCENMMVGRKLNMFVVEDDL